MSRGWYREPYRHSLASRGIKTTDNIKTKIIPIKTPDRNKELKEVVVDSKRIAMKFLNERGIKDDIVVKVKEFKTYREDWLALYRSHSQFHSKPIIWINQDIFKYIKDVDERINEYTVISDNIIHEYGHVIYEWAMLRNHELYNYINDNWTNEEDFAEGFIQYTQDDMWNIEEEKYDKAIEMYKKDMGW